MEKTSGLFGEDRQNQLITSAPVSGFQILTTMSSDPLRSGATIYLSIYSGFRV